MWLSSQLVGMFQISKETVESLREELAAARTERDVLKLQLSVSQNHFEWLRMRVNSLEVERAQLIKKAYGIDTPIPEIIRAAHNPIELNPDIFNDVGEDMAKKLGLPVYSNQ
jgi:predicted nuclease with TOPRIM domain